MFVVYKSKTTLNFLVMVFLLLGEGSLAQGLNQTWLLGYSVQTDQYTTSTKARLTFTGTSYSLIPEIRKMAFDATQGNISDSNGNLLMASNGCWVANSTGDTMLNGSDLNPGAFTDDYYFPYFGLPLFNGNVFLPYPGDSNKYVLFHQTGNYNTNGLSTELFYSIIDMTLDNGLGGVTQKNLIALQDTLGWGIGVCKHANARDWWIVAVDDSMKYIYKILFTPLGIDTISVQQLPNMSPYSVFAGQPTFSPDGLKFAFTSTYEISVGNWYHDLRVFSFDRCTGLLFDPNIININDGVRGYSTAFSPNSKYLYASSTLNVYQVNVDTSDIQASLKNVAINDNYYSPLPPLQTDFWLMYLAANGKIYISSGNGVIDIHFINYPDSSGISCDVEQHALHSPCWVYRGNVNHPNYYLGPVTGSICDSLTGVNEYLNEIQNFSVKPNPSIGDFSISYLLPQNKAGSFEVFDAIGKMIYKLSLPPWSTLQQINLPKLAPGVYHSVITSGGYRSSKKIVVMGE